MSTAAVTTNLAGRAPAHPTRRTVMQFITKRRRASSPRAAFLERFAEALGRPHVLLRNKQMVCWRGGGTLDHVFVYPWFRDEEAPRLTRIAVNHYTLFPSRRTLALLGFGGRERPPFRRELQLEFTVRDEELAAFAPWLALCIAGRLDVTRPVPAPPYDSGLSGEHMRTHRYAWTVAAWDACQAWHAKEKAKEAARLARRQAFLAARGGAPSAPVGCAGTTSVSTAVPGAEVLP